MLQNQSRPNRLSNSFISSCVDSFDNASRLRCWRSHAAPGTFWLLKHFDYRSILIIETFWLLKHFYYWNILITETFWLPKHFDYQNIYIIESFCLPIHLEYQNILKTEKPDYQNIFATKLRITTKFWSPNLFGRSISIVTSS